MTKFDKAMEHIFKWEGGYVNDAKDPGGETKYGICKRSHPTVDIKNLTKDQAKVIYKREYWDKCVAELLPEKLSMCVMDMAVNQGVSSAIKTLQSVLKVLSDGLVGNGTRNAAMSATDALVNDYLNLREIRYRNTKNFDIYGHGWMNRLNDLRKL